MLQLYRSTSAVARHDNLPAIKFTYNKVIKLHRHVANYIDTARNLPCYSIDTILTGRRYVARSTTQQLLLLLNFLSPVIFQTCLYKRNIDSKQVYCWFLNNAAIHAVASSSSKGGRDYCLWNVTWMHTRQVSIATVKFRE